MRKLASKTDDEILATLSQLRGVELYDTADMLLHIDEVKHRKLHLENGSRSIYQFLKEQHGYSKNQAYLRTRAAEALAIEPAVEAAVRENRVCITYLMEAIVAIRRESKRLRALRQPSVTLPEKRALIQDIVANGEAKRTIATHFPELGDDHNLVRPLTEELTQFSMAATQSEVLEIERVRQLLSTRIIDGNWHDVVMAMVKITISKLDRPAVREPDLTPTTKQRKYVSVDIVRAVRARAGNQCEWVTQKTGRRCDSRWDLQDDHIIPIATGGTDSFENFRLLCGAHNRYAAWKLGLSKD